MPHSRRTILSTFELEDRCTPSFSARAVGSTAFTEMVNSTFSFTFQVVDSNNHTVSGLSSSLRLTTESFGDANADFVKLKDNGDGSYTESMMSNPYTGSYQVFVFMDSSSVKYDITNTSANGIQAQTITFNPTTPVVLSPPNLPFWTDTLHATSSSGLSVSFKVLSSSGATNPQSTDAIGDTNLIVFGVGTVTVEAIQTGNSTFAAATPVVQTIAFLQPQTVTFNPSTTIKLTSNNPYKDMLQATSTSGLAVTFKIVSSTGATDPTLNGSMLTVNGTGTVTVEADQVGDTAYAAATPVTATITFTGSSKNHRHHQRRHHSHHCGSQPIWGQFERDIFSREHHFSEWNRVFVGCKNAI